MFRALPCGHPYTRFSRWSSTGLPGSWGVLSCLCPAHRPRPRPLAMPFPQGGIAPVTQKTKAAAFNRFSRLLHKASALTVYASRFGFPYTGKTRFRWVASPYRMGFEPIGLQSEFQVWWSSTLFQRSRLSLAPLRALCLCVRHSSFFTQGSDGRREPKNKPKTLSHTELAENAEKMLHLFLNSAGSVSLRETDLLVV
jgi:hypothetical protein